jgi:hypothetical protein
MCLKKFIQIKQVEKIDKWHSQKTIYESCDEMNRYSSLFTLRKSKYKTSNEYLIILEPNDEMNR